MKREYVESKVKEILLDKFYHKNFQEADDIKDETKVMKEFDMDYIDECDFSFSLQCIFDIDDLHFQDITQETTFKDIVDNIIKVRGE